MDIQPLELNDLNLISHLQPPDWNDITSAINSYINATFCFPIKATIDNKIVGIGVAIIHNDIAWLAHIIVHPDNRNQGIGKLITQALIKNSQAKGCDTVYLMATDLGEPVYKKVGFEIETEYLFFEDIKTDPRWAGSKNIVAYTEDFKTHIINLDRHVSGEKRSFQLEQHLTGGYAYLQNNTMEGFYLPTFGEGLIIANTASAGFDLMRLRLTTKGSAVFPIDNKNAREFMLHYNFKEIKPAKRMRFGIKRPWYPENIYNRVGGNLG